MYIFALCLFISLQMSASYLLDDFESDATQSCIVSIENDLKAPYFATPPCDLETFYNGETTVDDKYVLYEGQTKEVQLEVGNYVFYKQQEREVELGGVVLTLIPVSPLLTQQQCSFCHDNRMTYVLYDIRPDEVIKLSRILGIR